LAASGFRFVTLAWFAGGFPTGADGVIAEAARLGLIFAGATGAGLGCDPTLACPEAGLALTLTDLALTFALAWGFANSIVLADAFPFAWGVATAFTWGLAVAFTWGFVAAFTLGLAAVFALLVIFLLLLLLLLLLAAFGFLTVDLDFADRAVAARFALGFSCDLVVEVGGSEAVSPVIDEGL